MQVINNYRNDPDLRTSFNELAQKTFGIDFEDWYQNGYWTEKYNPYSIVIDGKVVANVSVNQTDFVWNGERKHLIQLGTVMTDEKYRNRGLIRRIMKKIEADYKDKTDGIYLFANHTVLDFYPKFGFEAAKQYEYVKEVHIEKEATAKKIPMNERQQWDKIEQMIRKGYRQSAFEMTNNSELNMFYITKYLQNDVYYCQNCDAYVVAEIENGELLIDMVVSEKKQDLVKIAESFGKDIHSVILGFTPEDTTGFSIREMNQDDSLLYVKGELSDILKKEKLMFPLLAHA